MDGAKSEPRLAQIINMLDNNVAEAREIAMAFDRKSRSLLDEHRVSGKEDEKEQPQSDGALPILQKLVYQLGEINMINRDTLSSLNELI